VEKEYKNMNHSMELLAPGGDVDSIKAAIIAGADAIYCGLDKFNARNRAANISFDNLQGILRLAHNNNCEVFLTLNTLIIENEIPALFTLLNKLVNTSIDGVIVQDLGMFYLLSKYFKSLKIHASTQVTAHNEGHIQFFSKLNATRVNLSRELNLHEIKTLSATAHKNKVLTEVFVHGSYCISFSGLCYISSVQSGNSGNRGRCSQPCRDEYVTTPEGNNFPLNLKDNSAYLNLPELYNAKVDSIKIEGRIKKFHYVYTIVDAYKKQIQSIYNKTNLDSDNSILYKVFNRDFSNSFLKGDIDKNMFIDNPRDHSAIHLAEISGGVSDENLEIAKKEIYDERSEIISNVRTKIDGLSSEKVPLLITISGQSDTQLKVLINTPDNSFVLYSETKLTKTQTSSLDYDSLLKRLKAINNTEYFIEQLELEHLENNVFIPFKELTSLKNRILFILNGSKENIEPIEVPVLKKHTNKITKPSLSILISSEKDLNLCNNTTADVYFQLPNCFTNKVAELVDLFIKNEKLIPWFPSILIGEDYRAAVQFINHVKPKRIVTNNTGIAYKAYEKGIEWIAGPFLNIVNSYSLQSLKENFSCAGAFISNEINKQQIRSIKKPENFKLFYSIYHPIMLMTSRQCFFHQVTGCKKTIIDGICISQCEKRSSITNLKNGTLFIEKSKGNLHSIYNDANFLNTDIVSQIPNTFSSFFIDLRNIQTKTKSTLDKSQIISLFKNHIAGHENAAHEIEHCFHPTTKVQFNKGI
jgi:putative protease